jgi:hypothetical protein
MVCHLQAELSGCVRSDSGARCHGRAYYRYALGPKATQLAVRFDAFHDAANCARVTSRLFELEPAPLTLPKGMWTETET